jgi:hypothetical protein
MSCRRRPELEPEQPTGRSSMPGSAERWPRRRARRSLSRSGSQSVGRSLLRRAAGSATAAVLFRGVPASGAASSSRAAEVAASMVSVFPSVPLLFVPTAVCECERYRAFLPTCRSFRPRRSLDLFSGRERDVGSGEDRGSRRERVRAAAAAARFARRRASMAAPAPRT